MTYTKKFNQIKIKKIDWDGLLTISVGIYAPAKLKFRLIFTDKFPDEIP